MTLIAFYRVVPVVSNVLVTTILVKESIKMSYMQWVKTNGAQHPWLTRMWRFSRKRPCLTGRHARPALQCKSHDYDVLLGQKEHHSSRMAVHTHYIIMVLSMQETAEVIRAKS